MQVSYGSVGFMNRNLEEALERIGEVGYTHTELAGEAPHLGEIPTGDSLQRLKQKLAGSGVQAGTLHAPLGRNVLGAPEEGWRTKQVGVNVDYLRLSGELGADGMVIHPTPNPWDVDDPHDPALTEAVTAAARRSLDELVPVALDSGVRMLLENLPFDRWFVRQPPMYASTPSLPRYPLVSLAELRTLIDPYPPEAVGLVIDTGHAWTSGNDPVGEIEAAGERLWGTHLQDVDGENPQDNHWAPTHGDLDWPAIRQALVGVDYRGHWTFEVCNPRDDRDDSDMELARITYDAARDLKLHA